MTDRSLASSLPSYRAPFDGSGRSGSNPSQATQPKAQTLVDNAVLAVENQPYISAEVFEEGEILGHPLEGKGRYFEAHQGPIPLIRLELTIRVDSITTSLVQGCNGTTFWTYRKLPNWVSQSKVDAYQAITAMQQAAFRAPPADVLASPGLGGLGRLLRALNAQFEFTSALPDEQEESPVWKLTGAWKPQVLARLLPDQNDAAAKGRPFDTTRLPGRLPDGATIYLRQSDYFPLRIDYYRGNPKGPQCLLSLKFGAVNFNGPIDSNQFLMPDISDYSDRTKEFIRSLGL